MAPEYVGIDLHRRRSVIYRMDEHGEKISSVRVENEPMRFAKEVSDGTCWRGRCCRMRKLGVRLQISCRRLALHPSRSPRSSSGRRGSKVIRHLPGSLGTRTANSGPPFPVVA
jgi:hypothetical protein